MKFRIISLVILLWLTTTIWAPTCGGGPTHTIYYVDNIGTLGLPVVSYSAEPVVNILNATDNASIADGLGYRCGDRCNLFRLHDHSGRELRGTTRVLLVVNNSGSVSEYFADLRYNGTGGLANCGGAAFVIENVTPANDPYLILAAFALVASVIAGFFILKNYFKK